MSILTDRMWDNEGRRRDIKAPQNAEPEQTVTTYNIAEVDGPD